MTFTAFWGRPFGDTRRTHEENGSTPSRAMAKIRREAVTIITPEHCAMVRHEWGGIGSLQHTYDEKLEASNNYHDYRSAATQSQTVDYHKGLRGVQREERVDVGHREEEYD